MFGLEREQDLDFQGVFRVARDGALHREADDFSQPNGLCLSPDEAILYVNDTTRAHIRAFDVAGDGSLRRRRIFAEGIGSGDYDEGVVDGMKCDEDGNVYVTGPRGIWVFDAQGRHLGVIRMPEIAGNMNWGGPHWNDLLRLLDVDLSRTDESAGQSGGVHEDGLIVGARARLRRPPIPAARLSLLALDGIGSMLTYFVLGSCRSIIDSDRRNPVTAVLTWA